MHILCGDHSRDLLDQEAREVDELHDEYVVLLINIKAEFTTQHITSCNKHDDDKKSLPFWIFWFWFVVWDSLAKNPNP